MERFGKSWYSVKNLIKSVSILLFFQVLRRPRSESIRFRSTYLQRPRLCRPPLCLLLLFPRKSLSFSQKSQRIHSAMCHRSKSEWPIRILLQQRSGRLAKWEQSQSQWCSTIVGNEWKTSRNVFIKNYGFIVKIKVKKVQ